MPNPWEAISLSDYESHMSLASVGQLQAMNAMMRAQLQAYPVRTAMVLGVAGGNGLEHAADSGLAQIYGVDVNPAYLEQTQRRYDHLGDRLTLLHADLTKDAAALPHADLVIANLLVEYIGYDCFLSVLKVVAPSFVSCGIQINAETPGWVSDSPFLHAFDGLDAIHHQMEPEALTRQLQSAGYAQLRAEVYPLPNGKQLVQLDFRR